jgi:hypothetical protein
VSSQRRTFGQAELTGDRVITRRITRAASLYTGSHRILEVAGLVADARRTLGVMIESRFITTRPGPGHGVVAEHSEMIAS